MKKLVVTVGVLALALSAQSYGATSKGIEGSPHDMSNSTTYPWNTRNGMCSPCHTIHHTDPSQIVPLWTHGTTTTTFTPYSSPTLQATVGQPGGVSLACLSCHDGTVALNSNYSAGTNSVSGTAQFINSSYVIPDGAGNDLSHMHPISFTYDAALATTDGQLENPTTYKIGDVKSIITSNTPPVPSTGWTGTSLTGKSIDQALLFNHKVECASCHDPHKLAGSAPSSGIMVRISGTDAGGMGSTLCRTCHIK